MIQRCLDCLKAAVAGQLDNLYTTALMSYTFTLAGDEEMRSHLIKFLHQKSNTQGEVVEPAAVLGWLKPGVLLISLLLLVPFLVIITNHQLTEKPLTINHYTINF